MSAASRPPLIRVIGSGPVALAFAAFARRQGLPADAIEIACHRGPPPAALAARVLALSLGTWQLLRRFAAPGGAAPIEQVDVVLNGLPGQVRLSAQEMKVPALGYVLRYGDLMQAVQQGLDELGVRYAPDPGDVDQGGASPVSLTSHCEAGICVLAQGESADQSDELRFDQAALLAEVHVEPGNHAPQVITAFECFTHDGPLALLPLPQRDRYSMVWCDQPHRTRERAALPAQQLALQLQQAFGWKLGRIASVERVNIAPMYRRARRELVIGNRVWIGNAAQALHPVAGQGLNLGMRDAFELAQHLGQTHALGRSLSGSLASYARERRSDRMLTIALTDTLARMFSVSPLRPFQSMALGALDLAPTIRQGFASHFMFGWR